MFDLKKLIKISSSLVLYDASVTFPKAGFYKPLVGSFTTWYFPCI